MEKDLLTQRGIWLEQRGGRNSGDIETDTEGDYVKMRDGAHAQWVKVYLPNLLQGLVMNTLCNSDVLTVDKLEIPQKV